MVRAMLPSMLAQGGGTIVNISSGAVYQPLEGWSAYCSSKAGLAMLTRSIALETAGTGVRVFGFSPGTIDPDMQTKIRASGLFRQQDIAQPVGTSGTCRARSFVFMQFRRRRSCRTGCVYTTSFVWQTHWSRGRCGIRTITPRPKLGFDQVHGPTSGIIRSTHCIRENHPVQTVNDYNPIDN